jgi:hypothetical protein
MCQTVRAELDLDPHCLPHPLVPAPKEPQAEADLRNSLGMPLVLWQ